MLSIVRMDFDSDVEVLEEDIKTEVIDIDENSNEDKKDLNILNNVVHDLELIPIVYTTKLDDMFVGRTLYPIGLDPKEATARIINESKPVLRTIPGPPKRGRKNKRRFSELEETLQRIYHPTKKIATTVTEPDVCDIRIDCVKSEVADEPIVEVKSKVLEEQSTTTAPKDTCKYSELLKQCKPCSVLLPVLIGYGQVLHGGQLLKANKVQKRGAVSSSVSSSDDDVPLITFPPDLLIERGKKPEISEKSIQPKVIEINSLQRKKSKGTSFEIAQRVLRNSLLEIEDMFSNEHFFYFTDNDGNLIHCFENLVNKTLYEATSLHEARYKVSNCCWVKKDEFVMSLYPKVLKYPNVRFIRTKHPCKPGACTCCCRKIEVYKKPDVDFSSQQSVPSSSKKSADDGVIWDLEEEIDVSIININRTPKLNSNEWLKNILTAKRTDDVNNSLIGKALNYKKPPPAKSADNRRLVTLKKVNSQNPVLVFRNYAEDFIEIYEVDSLGNIETYLRTTCYSNTSRPDVVKLLKKRTVTTEAVCCWYKREEVISKLHALHPDAIKFLRTTHTCQSKECKCCCKPAIKTGIQLDNIPLPRRSLHSLSTMSAWRPGNLSEKDDDDCQITSVMSSPTLKHLPQTTEIPVTIVPTLKTLPQNTAVPPSMFVTDVVDSDELSKEVNSLITSILDRFKDVRLTINGEGKVAAALNTPVNTLSTVELKVLANILSFAQSQVNLLGSKVSLGSSLCLSNIINLKVDDVQSNSTIDPNTVYREFGKNVNLNTSNTTQTQPIQPTAVNTNPPSALPQAPTTPQTYTFFTDSMSSKNQQFNDAFSSFVNSKIDANSANTETATPVIENVFSLKETETESAEETSACTTVWYRKPASQSSPSTSTPPEMTTTNNTSKKLSDGGKPETGQPKKIRVKSPTKLGAVTTSPPSIMTPNIPIQQTPPVEGVMPGVYVLPNNNFVVSPLAQPQMVNSVPPGQPPMLVINPLLNNGGTIIPINTPNGVQSKIPIIMNAANTTSQVINTGNNYITVEKDVPNQEAGAEVIENQDLLDDPVMDSAPDMDGVSETVCVLEDEGQKTDNDEDINNDDDIELKYSPENTEEEDCILGF
ncbi:uncharacterized protein LOC134674086 [Cydia fagiglandana]|uniref:uncharacterized protein LOC134674086 n=1 Tax=Cydia fagiglandana TaxID=1458189 RepID=UPI002FEE1DE7